MKASKRSILVIGIAGLAMTGCAGTAAAPATGTGQAVGTQTAPATTSNPATELSSSTPANEPSVAASVKAEVASQCSALDLDDEVRDIMGGPAVLVGNNDLYFKGEPACIYEPVQSPSPNGLTQVTFGYRHNAAANFATTKAGLPSAVPSGFGTDGFWWQGQAGISSPTQQSLFILDGTTEITVAGLFDKGATPVADFQRAKYEAVAKQLMGK